MFVRAFGFVLLVALLAVIVLVVLRARDAVAGYVERRGDPAPRDDGYAAPPATEPPAVPPAVPPPAVPPAVPPPAVPPAVPPPAAPPAAGGTSGQEAVAAARQDLHLAERDHARRVEQARSAVAEAGRDTVLVRVGPVVLGRRTLSVDEAVHELSATTVFSLDLSAEEPFLTVTDDRWGDAVELSRHHVAGARRLVVAGEGAVRNLPQARAELDQRLRTAQEELQRVQADTAEVDRARMTLEDLEGAPPRPIDGEDDGGYPPDPSPRGPRG